MLFEEQSQLWLPQSIAHPAFASQLSDFVQMALLPSLPPILFVVGDSTFCVSSLHLSSGLSEGRQASVWSVIGKPSLVRKPLNVHLDWCGSWKIMNSLMCQTWRTRRSFSLRNYERAKVDCLALDWKRGTERLRTLLPQISHYWRTSHVGSLLGTRHRP